MATRREKRDRRRRMIQWRKRLKGRRMQWIMRRQERFIVLQWEPEARFQHSFPVLPWEQEARGGLVSDVAIAIIFLSNYNFYFGTSLMLDQNCLMVS